MSVTNFITVHFVVLTTKWFDNYANEYNKWCLAPNATAWKQMIRTVIHLSCYITTTSIPKNETYIQQSSLCFTDTWQKQYISESASLWQQNIADDIMIMPYYQWQNCHIMRSLWRFLNHAITILTLSTKDSWFANGVMELELVSNASAPVDNKYGTSW